MALLLNMKLWLARQTWKSKDADKKAAELDYSGVKRITVIKHAALGDMLLTRPMLVMLKETFPNARLTLSVVSNYMSGIPEDLVDDVHVSLGNEKKYGIRKAFSAMRQLGPQDLIFDISATPRSHWLSKLTPAGLKIGFTHRGIHKFIYDVAIPRAHYRFEAETFLEQLNVIGLRDWPPRFHMVKPKGIVEGRYIVYFPTASIANKIWPKEHYVELIKHACAQYSEIKHILLSGITEWENDIADFISRNIGSQKNYVFKRGGESTSNLIANALVLVSVDTGIRNMAIAYDTPTLGIFPQSATIFGYTPLYGHHLAICDLESEYPDVEKVKQGLDSMMQSLGTGRH